MSEKFYWIVKREGAHATIRCPHCYEWYEIPNNIQELKCYRHCPWCGKPLFVKEDVKDGMNCKIEYVNEHKVRKQLSGISFIVLTVFGFAVAVCALCAYMVLYG